MKFLNYFQIYSEKRWWRLIGDNNDTTVYECEVEYMLARQVHERLQCNEVWSPLVYVFGIDRAKVNCSIDVDIDDRSKDGTSNRRHHENRLLERLEAFRK